MNLKHILTILICMACFCSHGQVARDTLPTTYLDSVTVRGFRLITHGIPDVEGVSIYAGKKAESIVLHNGQANLAQNLGRMVYAKLPGINLWEMDGAGTQMNIGSRGTDAHRAIEMNMRQNGYNTNSDVFGYPENHYTVPQQGVERIQFVRGSAALQFGPQFGGMMNYVMKEGDTSRVFSLESEQTIGSYNFFNSYNAIGGKKRRITYYAYYDNRHGDGWRPNSKFNYQASYADVKYDLSSRASISFQFSRMAYEQQIAGGQTDAQFAADRLQSNRERNYFSPTINIPAVTLDLKLSDFTRIEVTSHVVWGDRSSVQFINPATVMDTFNTDIGSYNHRQVDRDFYSGFTTEARLLHRYEVGSASAALSAGIRYFSQTTNRRQKGQGTTASDLDFTLTAPYGIDLNFHTNNYAIFAENIFWLTRKFSVTPGFRYELIQSELNGVIEDASFPVHYAADRNFPLFGLGLQYQVTPSTQLYANVSQAYRPYLYAYITPADQLGEIDPNLKDTQGYDIDLGYRGQLNELLSFDVNGYFMFYGDRIGNRAVTDPSDTYLLTTNIGDARVSGIEAYANLSLFQALGGRAGETDVRLFSSLAYTHARYANGDIATGGENLSIKGKHVENVPDWIERAGLEFKRKGFSTTLQASYVSNQFSDATNAPSSPSGIIGAIPAYTVWDLAFDWSFMKQYHVSGGINNLANVTYFSRRIAMYPGPGILPADGRTFYLTVGCKL